MELKLEFYYYCRNPQCVRYMRVWKEKRVCDCCGYDTRLCEDIMPIPASQGEASLTKTFVQRENRGCRGDG